MFLRKIKKYFLSTIATLCGVGFLGSLILYHYFPGVLHEIKTHYTYYQTDLSVKTLKTGPYQFEYFEGGQGSTVLFIHGFGSQKTAWIPYVKKIMDKHYVVAIDLPGHGNTPEVEGQSYDLNALADVVDAFVRAKGIKNFHLVGLSMGGGISSVYAAKYQQKLRSLTLLNPFGVRTPLMSDLERKMAEGKNVFFPNTVHELDELFHFTTGRPLDWAHHFKEYLLKRMKEKYAFFKKVFHELINSTPVDTLLSKIQTPTLLIIGGRDQVIHPSSLKIFSSKLPNVRSSLIPGATHIFLGEYFNEVIERFSQFIDEIDTQRDVSTSV